MKKNWFRLISVTGTALCAAALLTGANAENAAVPMEEFGDLELGIPEDAAIESESPMILDDVLELPAITEDVLPAPKAPVVEEAVIAQNPAPAAVPITEAASAPAPAPAAVPVPVTTPAATVPVMEENVLAPPALDAPEAAPVEVKAPAALPKVKQPSASIVDNPIPTVPQNAAPAMPVPQQSQEFVPGSYEGGPQGLVPGTVNRNCRNCQGNGPAYIVNPGPGRRAVIYGNQQNGMHAYPRRECPNCDRRYRGPMQDPYYSVRGPRDFQDPNPRTIGP